jgi:hypothetical protein
MHTHIVPLQLFTYLLLDVYGKIIVCSRIFNAIILWSMCALPFAKLGAIVLLCTMVASVVLQGKNI